MRSLMEWMGHRDIKTALIYADDAPTSYEAHMIERAFAADGGPSADATVLPAALR